MKVLTANEVVQMLKEGNKNFSNCKLYNVNFMGSGKNLSGIIAKNSVLDGCLFDGCKVTNSDFSNCKIEWSSFAMCDVTGSNFQDSDISFSSFRRSIVNNVNFKNCKFYYVLFIDTNTFAADLTNSSKMKFLTSWADITKEDIEFAVGLIEKVGLPQDFISEVKAFTKIIETEIEKIQKYGKEASGSGGAYGWSSNKSDKYDQISDNIGYLFSSLMGKVYSGLEKYKSKTTYK